ncbi:LeuA family protein [Streptomyces sp. SP2-10]|uniref:LeuA family protein n=1 Tax=Streptomyces sp. SP2-10 TaxID=2873385 RepID=UPI001CA73696|nr:pyruvate carboxyltransferase [Streptomyces sp. SP2-10]MBY8846087.1 pyruvate carboxyltransferase [Streptomyces sp. SP2-10]
MRRVSIFDTTLRDGEQAPGNAMRPEQKLELALAIEALGVDVIETGMPSSSASDYKATQLIAEATTTARIATLSRAVREDIRLAIDAGGAQQHQVQIMATGSETHLKHKRGISQAEAVREVVDAISYAKELGAEHVTLGLEDASRGSDGLLRELVEGSVAAGADNVGVADTTGCMTPREYGDLIARMQSWAGPQITISTHCHEDLGLSLANTLAGIESGAGEVQTSLAGIGERAGNTPLEELIAVLVYKGETFGVTTDVRPEGLYNAFEVLRKTINLPIPRNKAIFGANAFATQAGIHQAGMLRAPVTYEYVEPHRFGRERSILVGRHSGRAVLRFVMEEMGLEIDEKLVDLVYEQHVANRGDGDCLDLAGVREIVLDKRAVMAGGLG